jgi:hypothetical protein
MKGTFIFNFVIIINITEIMFVFYEDFDSQVINRRTKLTAASTQSK